MAQDTTYFSNGKYDIYKSEKRRQEVKKMVMGNRRTIPRDISIEEYNRQKDIQCENVAHRMMFKIFNQSKG